MTTGNPFAIANGFLGNGERLPQQQNPLPDEREVLAQQQESIINVNDASLQ